MTLLYMAGLQQTIPLGEIEAAVQRDLEKPFFFEKKNQKTFAPLRVYVALSPSHQKIKVFLRLFCSQKTSPSRLARPLLRRPKLDPGCVPL